MGHLHPVYDTDPHFHIDPVSRAITHTTPEKLILIQGDHNSQVYTFDIPRYVDGHDMMLCNLVQVHYINTDGTNSMNRSTGFYEVLDMQVSPEDPTVCVGSWLISKNATTFVGRLSFALRFACMNGTKLTYNWNSAVYDGVAVSTGYDYSDTMTDDYNDILEQWYWELLNAGVTGVNVVDEAKEKAIDEIESVLYSRGGITISETQPTDDRILFWIKPSDPVGTIRIHNLETGDFETITLNTLKGEKGDPGNPLEFISQEFGNDDKMTVSQEAVTIALDRLEEQINVNTNSCSDLEGDISCLNQDVYSLLISSVLDVDSDTRESRVIGSIRNWQSEVDSRCGTGFPTFVGDLSDKLQYEHTSGELGTIKEIQNDIASIETALGYDTESNVFATLETIKNDNEWFNKQYFGYIQPNITSLNEDLLVLKSLTNFDTTKYDNLKTELNTQLAGISSINDTQNGRLTTLETDVSELKSTVETNASEIDSLKDDDEELRGQISALGNRINTQNGTLSDYDTRISAVENLAATIANLQERVEWLEARYYENHE